MIKKDNNTVLKTKKVTGNLQSGEVAEGEEIPYSQYAVEEIPFDTIKISKYRKGVTLEAIAEKDMMPQYRIPTKSSKPICKTLSWISCTHS